MHKQCLMNHKKVDLPPRERLSISCHNREQQVTLERGELTLRESFTQLPVYEVVYCLHVFGSEFR